MHKSTEAVPQDAAAALPTRRNILMAGAALAGAGALAPLGSALAAEGQSPRIDQVFPLSGVEGDLVFLTGAGFDPVPGNNGVLLAGGAARLEVLAAADNFLVGVIGPVARAASGPVELVRGRREELPDRTLLLAGTASRATRAWRFTPVARPVAAPSFELRQRSPFTATGAAAAELAVDLGPVEGLGYGATRVEAWFPDGASQSFEVALANGATLPPQLYGGHVAHHLSVIGRPAGLSARSTGSRLVLARPASAAGCAVVRSC